MHITDGALSTPVMIGSNLVAAGVLGVCLRKIRYELVPRTGVLAAVFFLASLIHIRIGPSSAHLLLNGLLGLMLGYAAAPALVVALFLQTVLMGFGGITSLGANVLVMGLPALTAGAVFSKTCSFKRPARATAIGSATGALTVVLTCLLLALFLHLSNPAAYAAAVKVILVAHIPVLIIEAAITGAAVGFLARTRPELLVREDEKSGMAQPD